MISNPILAELSNHLWQSTLFAAAAGLLTLAFRKNRAQIRHGLWLTVSLKFLVPFSLLMSLGSQLQWAPAAKTMATQAVSYTMVEITQPFPASVPIAPAAARGTDWLPMIIFGVWACGFDVIALMRLRDWLRIGAAVRASTPLEMAALAGSGVEARSYPGLLEPGVVGLDVTLPGGPRLSRPILLLPAGIESRLTRSQMEAIFAHELCHVRRRDNLTAAMHMVVETVFWFHPLVWWVGARLVEERERACDEEVLRQGGEPQVYAEAILKVCKFYVESPLACMPGVTGSDLKKRIERIMKERIAAALSARKKLLLAAAGVAALALPIVAGSLTSPRLLAQSLASDWQAAAGGKAEFEVASVKQNVSADPPHSNVGLTNLGEAPPNGGLLEAVKFPLAVYIGFAYKLTPSQEQLITLPKWARSERFDIEARAGANATRDQMRLMMQALLADRFKLAVHTETRKLPVFGLVLNKPGKTGPQLTKLADDVPCAAAATFAPAPAAPKQDGWFAPCAGVGLLTVAGRAHVAGSNMTMEEIANHLQVTSWPPLDRPVFDQTGLSGKFDFRIEFTPVFNGPAPPNFQPDESGPTFPEALKEQLGLKLVPTTGPVDVLVIDHVEEPSDNSGQAPAAQSPTAQSSQNRAPNGPFHAGANGVGRPKCLSCTRPDYTEAARRANLQGDIEVSFVIRPDGHATDLKITKGVEGLNDMAIGAVKTWLFQPALGPDGKPMATITTTNISFHLLPQTASAGAPEGNVTVTFNLP